MTVIHDVSNMNIDELISLLNREKLNYDTYLEIALYDKTIPRDMLIGFIEMKAKIISDLKILIKNKK